MAKKLLQSTAARAAALIVFFAVIAAVILYQAGAYDIAFIPRHGTETESGSEPATEPPATDSETDPGTEPVPDTEPVTETDPSWTQPPEVDPDEILNAVPALADVLKAGKKVSTDRYGARSSLAAAPFPVEAPDSFSLRQVSKSSVEFYTQDSGLIKTRTVTENVDQPRISLYFGLILVDNGKSFDIYNAAGSKIVKNFSGTFVGALSKNGNPVVQQKKKYYEINPQKGLSAIDVSKVDFKALRFDYPAYYALDGKLDLIPFSEYVPVYTEVEIETQPPETAPPETTPPETTPPDTTPPDTQPPETTPPETEPPETTPPETTPPETTPPETTPPETTPPETTPPETTPPETGPSDGGDPEPGAEPTGKTELKLEAETLASLTTRTMTLTPKAVNALALPEGVVERDGKYYTVENVLMYGYRNAAGETVIAPQFASAWPFTEAGYAAVTDFEGSLFLIDPAGKEVVSLRSEVFIRPEEMSYVQIRQFYFEPVSNGLESIGMYYVDNGYVMMRYFRVSTFVMSRLYLNENRLVDLKGNLFDIPGGYQLLGYSDGILLLEKEGRYGYMDTNGAWVSPAVYQEAEPFLQGLAVARDENGRYGMIDTEGNVVLPFAFTYISNASRGYIAAYSPSRGWALYAVVA